MQFERRIAVGVGDFDSGLGQVPGAGRCVGIGVEGRVGILEVVLRCYARIVGRIGQRLAKLNGIEPVTIIRLQDQSLAFGDDGNGNCLGHCVACTTH